MALRLGNLLCFVQPVPFLLSIYRPTGGLWGRNTSNSVFHIIVHTHEYYHYRYLYYQSFGIDACFRFKRRQVSSYERDPELGPGCAYLVAWDAYSEYLCRFTDQREVRLIFPWSPSLETDPHDNQMSTCSGLAALDHANNKYSKGYATTGIVCTTCRHEFLLPEGAGPLQKGERLVFSFKLLV